MSADRFGIRRLSSADARAVAGIVQEAYAPYAERIGTKPGPMLEDYDEVLRRHPAWGAYEGNALLGVLVVRDDGERFVLDNVAVQPEAQGRGIGKALLAHGEREALSRGYDRVELYTNVAMTKNIALYAALGYVETERRREGGFDRVYMAKELSG
ncbi:MAG: GNAT family N-acetyltransferase [Dehalococcoidia bacterium]|nr:GNAT family N-acetyltransferase [Dehalococcoidia bacterium]